MSSIAISTISTGFATVRRDRHTGSIRFDPGISAAELQSVDVGRSSRFVAEAAFVLTPQMVSVLARSSGEQRITSAHVSMIKLNGQPFIWLNDLTIAQDPTSGFDLGAVVQLFVLLENVVGSSVIPSPEDGCTFIHGDMDCDPGGHSDGQLYLLRIGASLIFDLVGFDQRSYFRFTADHEVQIGPSSELVG